MNIKVSPITAMLASLALVGCAVGPDYRKPAVASPDAFFGADNEEFVARDVEREFWKLFNDAQLDALIERALAANHDIRIAASRLREARARRGESQLDLGPVVTASASSAEVRTSARQRISPDAPHEFEYYETGFDAAWELDFFGRTRRGVEARTAQLQAAEASLQDAQVSITAEVARQYFELRGAQHRLQVARRNAANQRATIRLTRVRLEGGRGTQLDVSRAQAQLSATLATIPDLEDAVNRAMLRIGVLIGEAPVAAVAELSTPRPLPTAPRVQRIGTPETLLRRRPDIRVAERELAAATAQIGIATADLFPRISFVGGWGFDALDSSDLGNGAANAWSFGPSIQWAAFDLSRVRRQIEQREAAADGALARYEKTVLRALEETDASLTAYAKAAIKQEHLTDSATASREAARLARIRFENGAEDFLAVLDAERNVLAAEDQLAQSETQSATALLALYKALGGGFRTLGQRVASGPGTTKSGAR